MKKPTESEVEEFLYQSNLIEGVDDPRMLGDAIGAWEFLMEQKKLTNQVVLQTHRMLMRNSGLALSEVGAYRKCAVYIANKAGLNYQQIPRAMEGWIAIANFAPYDWKKAHVEYENIHPFVDGNGRTGRMFMNWMRLQFNLPLLTIKASERWDYYAWFR